MALKGPTEKDPLHDKKELLLDDSLLQESEDTGFDVPARYIFTLLNFLALFTMYCLRTCLNVAMVAMVNSTALAGDNYDSNISSSVSHDCLVGASESGVNATGTDTVEGEFVWDEKTQGAILGAFYYGYTAVQVLVGWMADKVSGKRLMGGGLLLSSLLCFTIPTVATAGATYLIVIRVLQGFVESSIYPAMNVISAKWIPLQELNRLMSFCYSGGEIGAVCAMLLTGVLSKYGFAGGWPSAFYVFGMLGCVWFLLWMVLVYDSPADHPRISDRERRYIQSSLGRQVKVSVATPWRAILTSAPVWASCIVLFAYSWGYYSVLTTFPTYMKTILHFDIVRNGVLSALPLLLMWPTQVLAGVASDWMRCYVTTAFTRKVMYTVGCVFPACFLVATSYVDCDQTLAVVLVTIGITGKSLAASVVFIYTLDFAPMFAGTLFGLSNTFGSMSGFLAPSLIGLLTYQNQTIEQWRKFFYITAGIYAASVLAFLVMGRGEIQSWASPPPTSTSIPAPPPWERKKDRRKREAAAGITLEHGIRETSLLPPVIRTE